MHGKPGAKAAPKAAAPTTTKAPKAGKKPTTEWNANAVDILRDVNRGTLKLYGNPSKKNGGKPFWLYASTVAGEHIEDEQRVAFSKVEPLVQVTKTDEESGMLTYGVSAQGKQVLAATK